jgi:hypothetical protein
MRRARILAAVVLVSIPVAVAARQATDSSRHGRDDNFAAESRESADRNVSDPVLRVEVTDQEGRPVAGAVVAHWGYDGPTIRSAGSVVTDVSGIAVFEDPVVLTGRFLVTAHGMAPFVGPFNQDVAPTLAGRPLLIVLTTLRVVVGRVVDARDGRPVEGAKLDATDPLDRKQRPGPILATSAKDGRFVTPGLVCEGRDYEGVPPYSIDVAFTQLSKCGRAFDPMPSIEGAPLVRMFSVGRPGYRKRNFELGPSPKRVLDLGDIALDPTFEVAVTVKYEGVDEWPRCNVGADSGSSGAAVDEPTMAPDGSRVFRLRDLPGPDAGVVSRAYVDDAAGVHWANLRFLDDRRGYAPLRMLLRDPAPGVVTWKVLVTDANGGPVRNEILRVSSLFDEPAVGGDDDSRMTNEQGFATLTTARGPVRFSAGDWVGLGPYVPPAVGDARLTLVIPKHRRTTFAIVDHAGNAVTDVSGEAFTTAPRPSARAGRTFAAEPCVHAAVRQSEFAPGDLEVRCAGPKPAGQGVFHMVVREPAPPEWRLIADVLGFERAETPLWARPDDSAHPHFIRLRRRPACVLRIKVEDPVGAPVKATVFAGPSVVGDPMRFGYAGSDAFARQVATDAAGVAVAAVPQGEVAVEVLAGAFPDTSTRVNVQSATADLKVVVGPPGRVRVRLPIRAPVAAPCNVVLLPATGPVVECLADTSGVWTASNVAAGTYQAVLMAGFWPFSCPGERSIERATARGVYFNGAVLERSPPFNVAFDGLTEIEMKPKLGTLHLRCDGQAERVPIALIAADGRPLGMSRHLWEPEELTFTIRRSHVPVPLAVGRYRVRLEDSDFEPFEGTVTVSESGTVCVVPTRLRK